MVVFDPVPKTAVTVMVYVVVGGGPGGSLAAPEPQAARPIAAAAHNAMVARATRKFVTLAIAGRSFLARELVGLTRRPAAAHKIRISSAIQQNKIDRAPGPAGVFAEARMLARFASVGVGMETWKAV